MLVFCIKFVQDNWGLGNLGRNDTSASRFKLATLQRDTSTSTSSTTSTAESSSSSSSQSTTTTTTTTTTSTTTDPSSTTDQNMTIPSHEKSTPLGAAPVFILSVIVVSIIISGIISFIWMARQRTLPCLKKGEEFDELTGKNENGENEENDIDDIDDIDNVSLDISESTDSEPPL